MIFDIFRRLASLVNRHVAEILLVAVAVAIGIGISDCARLAEGRESPGKR